MPLVKISILKGKSPGYKKALLDSVHSALVAAFKIPVDDRNQRLYEHAEVDFEKRAQRSDNYTIIEITIFKGRTKAAKKNLYQTIVSNLSSNPGIDPLDVLILLNEQPLENWGIKGGKSADEVELGFKIDV